MKSDINISHRFPDVSRLVQRIAASRLVKRILGAAFLFFLIKGLIWLGVFAAIAWASLRAAS